MTLAATYLLADGADFNNTIEGQTVCQLITIENDLYKESLETLVLWLDTVDSAVCFGRDQALLFVPSNDGMHYYGTGLTGINEL